VGVLGELEVVLAKPKGSPNLSLKLSVLSFCMVYCSLLCNMLVGDLKCAFVVLERSPPYLFLYLLYFQQINKNKRNRNKQGLYRLEH
jgi:hypothetical protein